MNAALVTSGLWPRDVEPVLRASLAAADSILDEFVASPPGTPLFLLYLEESNKVLVLMSVAEVLTISASGALDDDATAHLAVLTRSAHAVSSLGDNVPMGRVASLTSLSLSSPLQTVTSLLSSAVEPMLVAHASSAADPLVNQAATLRQACTRAARASSLLPTVNALTLPGPLTSEAVMGAPSVSAALDTLGPLGDQLLHDVQAALGRFAADIERLTSHPQITAWVPDSTVESEREFWLSLGSELADARKQLASRPCQLALAIMKQAKRFWATTPFDSDSIGLVRTSETTAIVAELMKELPVGSVTNATSLDDLASAIELAFAHLRRARPAVASVYPNERQVQLATALVDGAAERCRVLAHDAVQLDAEADGWSATLAATRALFDTYDSAYEAWLAPIREAMKRRGEEHLQVRVSSPPLKVLRRALAAIERFRRSHDDLRRTIAHVFPLTETEQDSTQALAEVDAAYGDVVASGDPLDGTEAALDRLQAATTAYDERIDVVESAAAERLRARLGAASTAVAMFRVFRLFAPLLSRPRIRAAVRDFQATLLAAAQDELASLHSLHVQGYPASDDAALGVLRDAPPLASAVAWARSLEGRLDTLLSRVGDALGAGWESSEQGAALAQGAATLRSQLDSSARVAAWFDQADRYKLDIAGRLLRVRRDGSTYTLHLNFEPETAWLFKETRQLAALGVRVPIAVALLASQAKQVYPFAVRLGDALRRRDRALDRVRALSGEEQRVAWLLVDDAVAQVQRDVRRAFSLAWDSLDAVSSFTDAFVAHTDTLSAQAAALVRHTTSVATATRALASCPLRRPLLLASLSRLQQSLDSMHLVGFSQVGTFVSSVQRRVESILRQRLEQAAIVWIREAGAERERERERERGRRGGGGCAGRGRR